MSKRRRNNRPVECSVPESNYRRIDKSDWRTIQDDREKYNAYLCSREWAERREAVRSRACGACERCEVLPMSAVHHLTYARKYDESLEDLQAICQQCHDFTHGKDWFDPKENNRMLLWLLTVKSHHQNPIPVDLLAGRLSYDDMEARIGEVLRGAHMCWVAGWGYACKSLIDALPFSVPDFYFWNPLGISAETVRKAYEITGFDTASPHEWFAHSEAE